METNIITSVILPAALFVIMLGMGLTLTTEDFRRILRFPKAMLIGITNQLILVPILGFLFASLFPLKPELAVGIMIIAACPGGPTSNLIAYLAKGDTALSISLTAVSSFVTILTIPFIINFSLLHFMQEGQVIQLDVLQTVIQILAVTIIPVSIGMLLKSAKPALADKLNKSVKIASAAFLVLVIAGVVLKERANFVSFFMQAGLPVFALNASTMLVGYITAKLFKLSQPQSVTIAIESGIQNGTLGILIAGSLLLNSQMTIPPAIYSLIIFATGGIAIFLAGRKKEKAVLG